MTASDNGGYNSPGIASYKVISGPFRILSITSLISPILRTFDDVIMSKITIRILRR
jgi:hypothetical protein